MKILVFTPTHRLPNGKLAIWPECKKSRALLDHGEHDVTVWQSVDKVEDRNKHILEQYQRAQARVLRDGFDALLTFEGDMIVPPDALVKMAATDAPVVYGVYVFRHGMPMLSATRWANIDYFDSSLQLFPDELRKAVKAGVWRVSGLGFGCTFIRREILERLPFRNTSESHFPDATFAEDCQKAKILQVARFDVPCGHIREDGVILWPDYSHPEFTEQPARCEILANFHGGVNGESIAFKTGTTVSIPATAAHEFERAGFVRVL